jgi:hypothetical protein
LTERPEDSSEEVLLRLDQAVSEYLRGDFAQTLKSLERIIDFDSKNSVFLQTLIKACQDYRIHQDEEKALHYFSQLPFDHQGFLFFESVALMRRGINSKQPFILAKALDNTKQAIRLASLLKGNETKENRIFIDACRALHCKIEESFWEIGETENEQV